MRALIALIALSALLAASAAAHAPSSRSASLHEVTGIVRALGLTQVTVGRTTCALTSERTAALAQGFAVGETVTVTCLDGALRTMAIAPITGGPSHPDSIVVTLHPTAPTSSAGASPNGQLTNAVSGGRKMVWSTGSTGPSTVTGTVAVSGTITSVSGGITVDGQTCPMLTGPTGTSAVSSFLTANVQVGEQAQMSCTLYSDGLSSGSISTSPASS